MSTIYMHCSSLSNQVHGPYPSCIAYISKIFKHMNVRTLLWDFFFNTIDQDEKEMKIFLEMIGNDCQ